MGSWYAGGSGPNDREWAGALGGNRTRASAWQTRSLPRDPSIFPTTVILIKRCLLVPGPNVITARAK